LIALLQTVYDEQFFGRHIAGSLCSARAVLPLLFKFRQPVSVIDAGCGTGAWLKAASELGATEIIGLDGPWVDRTALLIPPACFREWNLARPLRMAGRYDLAISIETAEHLPYERSESFVADLCGLSDMVLFSAAVPYQGGVAHINEQWLEFWAILFRRHGYLACDVLRERIWPMPEVEYWYKQNLLVFAKAGLAREIFPEASIKTNSPLSLCHPLTLAVNAGRFRPLAGDAADLEFADYEALLQAYASGSASLPALKLPPSPLFPDCRIEDRRPAARVRERGMSVFRRLPATIAGLALARLRGVKPGEWFDSAYYLRTYPDVARSGMNPLAHYLLFGMRERRRPHPLLPPRPAPPGRAARKRPRAAADPAALDELRAALSPETALVSIVIPTYDHGAYLKEAVDSALAQTYRNVEVIVVDDGSTDAETPRVLGAIQDPRVRVIRQQHQGLASARNNGMGAARGDYLVFLDADDRLERHAAAILLYALLQNPGAAYAYPAQRFFGDEELVWTPQAYNGYDLLWSNHPSACSMIRREAAGRFRPEMDEGYEDWEYWVRLSGEGRYGLSAPAPVFEHRRHGVTMTHTAHAVRHKLYGRLRAANSALYSPEAVTRTKLEWRPLVSIVIPYYNGGAFLRETLDSLAAQTTQDFETILVNDGSDDPESLRALDEARAPGWVRVMDLPHGGPSAARNAGARAARSEYLMFLDCDDLLDPGAVEKLCWTLSANPRLAFVYSGVRHFGEIDAVCYDEFDPFRLRKENYLAVTCALRRDVFFELGGFDESLRGACEDYDLWLRLADAGHRGQLFREPLFQYRRHSAGRTGSRDPGVAAGIAARHSRGGRPEPERPQPDLIERAAAALFPEVEERRYRRPNVPNLFSPARWNSRRINVLYLVPGFEAGGAEAFDLRVLSCLPRERFSVALVSCGEPDGPRYEEFRAAAGEIYSLERMVSGGAGPEAFLRYVMIAKSVDIVVNRNTRFGYELAAEWPRVTRQVRFADLLHLDASRDGWPALSAAYHDGLDLRYVVSEDLKRMLAEKYGLAGDRIRVLYYGLDAGEMRDGAGAGRLRLEFDIPEGAPVLGYVGRFTEQKDPLRWLAVAARVASAMPGAVFLMVGDGELLRDCRKAAKKLGIADRVRFAGYRRDAAACTAAMDALLMTSRYEGLPLVVLESLAHGTPVVAANVGGMRECLPEGLGLLVARSAGDADFAAAAVRAFGMKADAGFAASAREFLQSRFSKERMQQQLERDFTALAAGLDRERRLVDYQLDVMAAPILE
jgi:glycosyltransferase involved in cell wall biosynthesis/SAM-dependent methyltransferase